MKFSERSAWNSLKTCIKLFLKLREIFFKLTHNSPKNYVKFLKLFCEVCENFF